MVSNHFFSIDGCVSRRSVFWISLFMLMFCDFHASAQKFDAGIRFGMTASQVNGDRLSGYNKAGLLGGGFVRRELSEHSALQMEIVFIQKGSRKPTDDYNSYYRMRVHYLEVPVLYLYKVKGKLWLTAGPSFGTLVYSSEADEFGVYPDPLTFRKFEFAGNGGIQYTLGDHWLFDGRYSHSISTIRPFPGKTLSFFDRGQYNVVLEFSLLHLF